MDSTYFDLYNQLISCINQNQVKQSIQLIKELKQKETMKNHMLIELFRYTNSKPRRISVEIRKSLITHLMQPALASLELNKNHPLWITVDCGDFKSLKLLLDSHKFDLNAVFDEEHHDSLLHHAVIKNYKFPVNCIKIIDLLLKHGAEVNALNKHNENVLCKMIRSVSWNRAVVDFLFKNGASVDAGWDDNHLLIYLAICFAHKDLVFWLLDHSNCVDVNPKTGSDYYETPLSFAVARSDESIVKLLLQRGANVNERVRAHMTMLHIACIAFRRNKNVVQVLLEFGAKIDAKDFEGKTPFVTALRSARGDPRVLTIFIKEFSKIKFKEEIDSSHQVTDLTDLQLIDQNHPELKVIYDNCLEELRKMNGIILHKSISIYEALFSKTSRQLALLLRIEEIAKLFNDSNIEKSFPLHGPLFTDKIKKAYELKEVIDELDDKLYSTIGPLLPDVVMRTILKMLYQSEVGF